MTAVLTARPRTVVSPVPAAAWRAVLAHPPGALPSQTRAWLRCVCAVDGYQDASRLYETVDGRRLVLPLVRRTCGRMPVTHAALPVGWGAGGLISDGGPVRAEDVRMVAADLAGAHSLSILLRPDPTTATMWAAGMPAGVRRVPRMAQILSLDGGFDEVWRHRFRGDTRNRVRRAERAGVVIERDDTGRLVPAFQRLYAESVDRWARQEGVPLALARWRAARREPARKLPTVAATLGASCRLYGAFLDGRPIAAIVVLFGPATAVYWRGAMAEQVAGPVYANYLLHRAAIQDAAEAGCTAYQMGDSAPGSSLALFKSRFGAAETHYANYRIERLAISALVDAARAGARRIFQLRADQLRADQLRTDQLRTDQLRADQLRAERR
jgi:hypothetical protein